MNSHEITEPNGPHETKRDAEKLLYSNKLREIETFEYGAADERVLRGTAASSREEVPRLSKKASRCSRCNRKDGRLGQHGLSSVPLPKNGFHSVADRRWT